MVKYSIQRIKERDKQYQEFCQRKEIRPGVYQRISWELMTRGIIPDDNFEHLNIHKLTLERIFISLVISVSCECRNIIGQAESADTTHLAEIVDEMGCGRC